MSTIVSCGTMWHWCKPTLSTGMSLLHVPLVPPGTKRSQTARNLKLQNLSCHVFKPVRLSQRKDLYRSEEIEPSWSIDIEFLWKHTTHLSACYLQSNSPTGWLSPTETCRRHSCIKHSDNTKKAVDIFLERGMITSAQLFRQLFSATHLHVHSGIEWRH